MLVLGRRRWFLSRHDLIHCISDRQDPVDFIPLQRRGHDKVAGQQADKTQGVGANPDRTARVQIQHPQLQVLDPGLRKLGQDLIALKADRPVEFIIRDQNPLLDPRFDSGDVIGYAGVGAAELGAKPVVALTDAADRVW